MVSSSGPPHRMGLIPHWSFKKEISCRQCSTGQRLEDQLPVGFKPIFNLWLFKSACSHSLSAFSLSSELKKISVLCPSVGTPTARNMSRFTSAWYFRTLFLGMAKVNAHFRTRKANPALNGAWVAKVSQAERGSAARSRTQS